MSQYYSVVLLITVTALVPPMRVLFYNWHKSIFSVLPCVSVVSAICA